MPIVWPVNWLLLSILCKRMQKRQPNESAYSSDVHGHSDFVYMVLHLRSCAGSAFMSELEQLTALVQQLSGVPSSPCHVCDNCGCPGTYIRQLDACLCTPCESQLEAYFVQNKSGEA